MSTAINSDDNPTPSCFSGFLRRVLCSGTSPSDHIAPKQQPKSPIKQFLSKSQNASQSSSTSNPGVIARLMGLESLPEDINWTPKPRTTLESILRSKSVNSFDFVPHFDLKQTHHRRIKTSVSFREVPTFLSQEKHDLFVLCLEKLGKSDVGLVEERSAVDERSRGKNREKKIKKAVDLHGNRKPMPRGETRKAMNAVIKSVNEEERPVKGTESKVRRRKKQSNCKQGGGGGGGGGGRRRRVQPVCSLEDDSVLGSVLHLPNIPDLNYHEMPTPTRPEDRRARISNSTRKFTSTKNNSTKREYDNLTEQKSFKDDTPMKKRVEASTTTTTTTTASTCDVVLEELVEICKRLAEEDLKDSIWTGNNKYSNNSSEHIEDICNLLQQQILDLMFDQLLDDIMEL